MAKITIDDISSGFASQGKLNAIFQQIQNALNNDVLYRNNPEGEPNTLSNDIDMNSNDILNAGNVYADDFIVNGQSLGVLESAAADAEAQVTLATAQATAAAASASAAATSEANVQAVEDSLPDWQGPWVTATAYAVGDLVRESGSVYICLVAHTSGTFATDLSSAYWELFAQKGDAGAGTGDMLAANNLSDVSDPAASRANIGVNNVNLTITAGNAMSGGGVFTTNQTSNSSVTLNHADTSSQANVSNTGNTVIQSANLDDYGHVTSFTSKTIQAPSAWVNFNGTGVLSIRDSHNVASVTDNGVGDYTVNFNTALANANYAVIATCSHVTGNSLVAASVHDTTAPTTSAVRILVRNQAGGAVDPSTVSVVILGG